MIKTFTPDDLLRYLYEDTSIEEKEEIEKALQNDYRLLEELEQLKSDIDLVDEMMLAPSDKCIDHIMGYARAMNLKVLIN